MFLAFQHPEAIPGVSVVNFSPHGAEQPDRNQLHGVGAARLRVMDAMSSLGMDSTFADRYVNQGFSGGERKRKRGAADGGARARAGHHGRDRLGSRHRRPAHRGRRGQRLAGPERGFLIITHYQRLLDHITPDRVHVLVDGRIVESGDIDLARRLEAEGYEAFRRIGAV